MSGVPDYDPRYLAGVLFFNRHDFFEAHEVWENLWGDCNDRDRRFYQALIQAAVALHHFGNGNIRGARKLYHSSRSYLEPYRPHHLGLDLEKFFRDLETCFRQVLISPEEFPQIEIVAELIPEIHLEPPPE